MTAETIEPCLLPRHVGMVMGGNCRWAKKAGFTNPGAGHDVGADHVEDLLGWCKHERKFTCERAGIAPGEALMVGNSLVHDVLGPLEAGLDATLLDRHGVHLEAAVRRISTLHDLRW